MINTIFNEDCLQTLDRMEDGYIDLTITSPPYNVDLKYDQYCDKLEYESYICWLSEIFDKIYSKTKLGGRCVINIGDQKNGQIPLHSDVIQLMIKIGWLPFTIILWDKQNCKSRTAWGSYMLPSQPSFPRPFEYILVFAKEFLKLQNKGQTDLKRQEFIDWSLGIWRFNPETKKIRHPAPFPIELPQRCMKMLSWIDSIVYDPFMGSGTTAIACKLNQRIYIGSEISKDYCDIANERIQKIKITKKDSEFF